jgi:glucose-6-phosphate isomerase
VELGKKMAKAIDSGEGDFDPSTMALMRAAGLT